MVKNNLPGGSYELKSSNKQLWPRPNLEKTSRRTNRLSRPANKKFYLVLIEQTLEEDGLINRSYCEQKKK